MARSPEPKSALVAMARRAGSSSLMLTLWRWVSLLVWGIVAAGLLVLHLLWSSPLLLNAAWQDWRFHKERFPLAGYTLWQAVRFSYRMWWQEVRW